MNAAAATDCLNGDQEQTLGQAWNVAEEVIGDHYRLTASSWQRLPYDLKTLKELVPAEVAPEVFAQVVRCGKPVAPAGLRIRYFYRICLQDHNILKALRREDDLTLLPFLVYIATHELIHVVRFHTFHQFFDADPEQRAAEEKVVHDLTWRLLRRVPLKGLGAGHGHVRESPPDGLTP